MFSLGVDTSNYTTSVALYDGTRVVQKKRLLPVKPGALGLRQSDALFHHTVALPELLEELLAGQEAINSIAVSDRPRNVEGSYMPCFLAGVAVAQGIASALNLPLRKFSHQQGHLAAALFSCGRMDLLQSEFLAFHVSGGTTECLLIQPGLKAQAIGGTADLNAGQLVDRVGVMLGFDFPAGKALDELAQSGELPRKVNVKVDGLVCHLSGIENQCRRMHEQSETPEDIARYCLEAIAQAMIKIAGAALDLYGELPVVCSGGVCCSEVVRASFLMAYPQAQFAAAEYSADNAAGIAILATTSQIQAFPGTQEERV